MKKSKLLLPICLIVALVILITAVIVSLTAGINLGVDFVGGKQIEIQMDNADEFATYNNAVKSTLSAHGLAVDSSFTEGKYTHTYYVAKIRTGEISDEEALSIRTEIASSLTIDADNVSELLDISGNVKQKTVINVSIAIAAAIIIMFVVAWIRYGIMNGLALLFHALVSLILSFAMIFITRVQLNVSSCCGILVSVVAGLVLFTAIIEKVREATKSSLNKNVTSREMYVAALKDTIFATAIIFGGITLFSLFMLFISASYIVFFALSTVISALATVFALVLSTELAAKLYDISIEQTKQKLSKNNNSK